MKIDPMMRSYFRGVRAGVPIGLGYLSVSFSLGILAVSMGMYVWQAVLISMVTLTSAGQLSGIHTMNIFCQTGISKDTASQHNCLQLRKAFS